MIPRLSFAAFLTTAFCAAAQGQTVVLQPRASVGTQSYELGFEDVLTPDSDEFGFRDGFKVADSLTFFGAGLTASRGSFFADLSIQSSGNGKDSSQIYQGTQTPNGTTGALGHLHDFNAEFDREEINATLGWGVTADFSVYLGYKHAKLDMTQSRSPVTEPAPDFDDVIQNGKYTMDFSYDGIFVGATYSIPVSTWGALSIQSSLANLDASFKQRFDGAVYINRTPRVNLNPAFITGKVDGDSLGLNLGISWTGNFGWASESLQKLSYTLGIDRSQYEFDADGVADGDFEEKNTRTRLEVRYRFDL